MFVGKAVTVVGLLSIIAVLSKHTGSTRIDLLVQSHLQPNFA